MRLVIDRAGYDDRRGGVHDRQPGRRDPVRLARRQARLLRRDGRRRLHVDRVRGGVRRGRGGGGLRARRPGAGVREPRPAHRTLRRQPSRGERELDHQPAPSSTTARWLPDSEYVSVLPATPPSSLGGDSPSLSDEANWILDHIEGFVWPNADTDRLRSAAHVVARPPPTALDGLADPVRRRRPLRCGASAPPRSRSRSRPPTSSRRPRREVAGQFAALATACDEYAAQVDQKRAEIRALLEEILAMVVEGIVVSAAIGLITGGAGAVAGSSAVVAKVAAQSPRFAAILAALRTAVAASSAYLRTTHAALRASRLRLGKFAGRAACRCATSSGMVTSVARRMPTRLARGARTLGQPHDREARRQDRGRARSSGSGRALASRGRRRSRTRTRRADAIGRLLEQATRTDRRLVGAARSGDCRSTATSTGSTGTAVDRSGQCRRRARTSESILDRDAAMPDGYPDPTRPTRRRERAQAMTDETPALQHLIGAYFHQDFRRATAASGRPSTRSSAKIRTTRDHSRRDRSRSSGASS